ncbi:MAG: HEAT repeat domain-containing protein, partial [Candidatus Aminicenantes bacterium]|nr:HEAT repeat domain-containing protein [Candidatus Aminicenantes bacterium]
MSLKTRWLKLKKPDPVKLKAGRDVEGLSQALSFGRPHDGEADWIPQVRMDAAAALAELGDDAAIASLIGALGPAEENEAVRTAVAAALRRARAGASVNRAADALAEELKKFKSDDEHWPTGGKERLVRSIGELQAVGMRAVDALVELFKEDGESSLRSALREALKRIDGEYVDRKLTEILSHPNAHLRTDAARLLAARGKRPGGRDLEIYEWIFAKDFGKCAAAGNSAVEPLIRCLQDENPEMRDGAAAALGKIGSEKAVPHLAALGLAEKSLPSALAALRRIGGPAVVRALLKAAGDKSLRVRSLAGSELGGIVAPGTVDAYVRALRDEDAAVRAEACRAIGNAAPDAAPQALLDALEDTNVNVCRAACQAAGDIRDPRAIPGLIKLLACGGKRVPISAGMAEKNQIQPPSSPLWEHPAKMSWDDLQALRFTAIAMQEKAAWALGRMGGDKAAEALGAALGDRELVVSLKAVVALREIGGETALRPAIQALKQSNDMGRKSAALVLGEIGGPAVINPLAEALYDRHLEVRATAAEALMRLGWKSEALDLNVVQAMGAKESFWGAGGSWARFGKRGVEALIVGLGDER